jgi:DNA-binding response OmpR family regulator
MKQRILIVDDEPQIREMLSLYFERHNFVPDAAADSQTALRKVREGGFDVVVLDIGLADEDGLKVLEQLKAEQPGLRVIMLTGMGFVEDLLQEAQQKGADGYVSKVLPLDELLMAIQRILKTEPAS